MPGPARPLSNPPRPKESATPPHPEEPGPTPGVTKDAPPRRRYGGIPLDERQAERRDRLVRAAINVSARLGREGASVAAICAQAGLTARYFYESFANRDALFIAAFRRVQDELFSHMQVPTGARDPVRGALTGFFATLADHPGAARVFLLDLDEHDPAMKELGRAAGQRLATFFAPGAATHKLTQAGIAGAIVQIAKRWIESGFAEPIETVVTLALPFTKAAAGSATPAKSKAPA